MSKRIAIRHQMHYDYDRLINLSPQVIRLKPASHSRTHIHAYSLNISPSNHFINWQQDPFGNYIARVVFPEKISHLYIDVEVIADMVVINPFDFFIDEYAEKFPFTYEETLAKELGPYFEVSEDSQLLKDFIKGIEIEDINTVDFLVKINQHIYNRVAYTVRMEPGVQSSEETLQKALGSCRDSAWLMVQVCRHLGLAARFASGYLVQLTADEKSLDGPSGPEQDFTDLHAWCEVYVPGAGWVGLDPTSGLFAGEGHIPLTCTPQPGSAAPITGSLDFCKTTFSFKNEVFRIYETPRVTKPYTEQQWQSILALGDLVDQKLVAQDVRLSMGGEPTFVSIDDMEAAEWNVAADGEHKRKLAKDLTFRLRERFAPNGMLHFGQGKQYPGELLPRWQYGIIWRKDGKAIWEDTSLISAPGTKGQLSLDDAKKFGEGLAEQLGIDKSALIPALEDLYYFAWEEAKLSIEKDPLKLNLKDPIERRTLTENLQYGLEKPKGYVLPLRFELKAEEWQSCVWPFKRKHLFLLPGNSPIGYRLPLSSLPESIIEEELVERDPFAELPDLPDFEKTLASRKKSISAKKEVCFKTAICFEIRDGVLHVFMPPVNYLEHYLELVTALQLVAKELQMPVCIEGYEPPSEGKIHKMGVTPDPGVIEVNVHPTTSWAELVSVTQGLYEQAKLSRLGTEKFMLDGRHTGTGGGNHITIGGITPADSPLLRRPKLLQSLITFWQHHPSLSYLFSGSFIGSTSQAPRVDESRAEILYELEIAFSQVPTHENPPFWTADRLFRNLLIDVTGNTHRSEFCIDKLYSPYGSTGRLGILEFRGFDMPPHAQMSLCQNLLIRALIARFWDKPYEKNLIRWGTDLHDKFLMEHYVKNDILQVVEDLQMHGIPFEPSWFDAFLEFRFPVLGKVQIDEMEVELRWALEPWNVLGEESTSQGTARYVDSSLERVQLKVSGWLPDRYKLLCNRRMLPMKSTGTHGVYVTGVKYKAWAPFSALHPGIGVDTPLTFDIYDSWNQKAIGGFTYHVSHPGGRSYDTFPVNSYEAEARRQTRFNAEGHTQAQVSVIQEFSSVGRYVQAYRDSKIIENIVTIPESAMSTTFDLRKTH